MKKIKDIHLGYFAARRKGTLAVDGNWFYPEPDNYFLIRGDDDFDKAFMELQAQSNEVYKIISHRNKTLTKKFKGKTVSLSWIQRFCLHHSNIYLESNARFDPEQSKRADDAEDLTKKKADDAEDLTKKKADDAEDPDNKEISKKLMDNYKNKSSGYSPEARICPVCSGDGGVRNCFKCDGTGWV